jgi:hypothetical protein
MPTCRGSSSRGGPLQVSLSVETIPLVHRLVRRYLTFVKTRLSSKGQIVLPAELRQQDGIEARKEPLHDPVVQPARTANSPGLVFRSKSNHLLR